MQASREEKLESLRQLGQNPYNQQISRTHTTKQAREADGLEVTVAGRVMAWRGHGKIQFADLVDESGKIQLAFKADDMADEIFENLSLIDVSDILEAKGTTFTTKAGERTVQVKSYHLLTKSVRPIPSQWYGLKDVEERYRQRYVDLNLNPKVREVFMVRSKLVKTIRDFFDSHGFLEVETPILQPIYGGATAKPFTTLYNALGHDFYLRIADELYLKRLIVGGFEKVYEIGHDFRNEGLSRVHSPEFTQIEFYWAYATYENLMDLTEELFEFLLTQLKGGVKLTYQGKEVDFTRPWPRISYAEALKKFADVDINEVKDYDSLLNLIKDRNIKLERKGVFGYASLLDTLYKKLVRPQLHGPLFLTDYPYEMKPLAKRKADNPNFTANFQLLAAGEELVNAYNELNDPFDQRARWEEEARLAERGLEEHQVIDEDYIRALEYGMPPTAGWGMGIDRLTMLFTDQPSIRDVILFPTLRPEFTLKNKKEA